MNIKKIPFRAWLLLIALISYIYLIIFNQSLFLSSIKFFLQTLIRIIPAFILVFAIMTLANYFITSEKILKFSKKKGPKKWFLMSFAGIFSTGPPYLWYPLLRDLNKQGLSYGLITTYLYNRAVVIAFIPLLIYYFSLKFALILSAVITLSALLQGLIINKIIK